MYLTFIAIVTNMRGMVILCIDTTQIRLTYQHHICCFSNIKNYVLYKRERRHSHLNNRYVYMAEL